MKYTKPAVTDYGDLVAMTADGGALAHVGLGTLAAVSSPVVPGGGAGGSTTETQVVPGTGGDVAGDDASGMPGDSGDVAGDTGSSGDPSGSAAGSGGGSGSGGGGSLPFTGFAAGLVGAIGAALAGAGAAARRRFSRD